eukprot:CAMPEP_0171576310 /NCGR_PEP_ID=MMETSP0961-20121227/6529_1 /TAXON_ID=87120 /ORGANISM="Aurantiochytrium limacinum, Strain ATCCMYA-1381" /LENGTH=116 /DNA_ID=CAMNT_0012132097 /DNA_START=21 /DNA_END=372 /DNA_ORIENTATION=+
MEGALRGTVEALAREAPAKAAWVAWAAEERLSRSLATTVELAMEGALRGTVEALAREAPAKAAWVAWAAEERLSRSLATTVELSDGGQDNAMKMLMILTMSILGVIVLLFALCGAG